MTLAEQRESVGLTQQQCAALVGVTRVTWTRWETGVSVPPVASLRLWRHLVGLERLPDAAPQGDAPGAPPDNAPP